MKLLCLASFVLALSATAIALPTNQVRDGQAQSAYPIGTSKSQNAKVAGRVFNIDGRVGYFAGNKSYNATSFRANTL